MKFLYEFVQFVECFFREVKLDPVLFNCHGYRSFHAALLFLTYTIAGAAQKRTDSEPSLSDLRKWSLFSKCLLVATIFNFYAASFLVEGRDAGLGARNSWKKPNSGSKTRSSLPIATTSIPCSTFFL